MKVVFLVSVLVGISIIGCGSNIPKKISETIFVKRRKQILEAWLSK